MCPSAAKPSAALGGRWERRLQAASHRCRPEAELLQPRGRTVELHGHHALRCRH